MIHNHDIKINIGTLGIVANSQKNKETNYGGVLFLNRMHTYLYICKMPLPEYV